MRRDTPRRHTRLARYVLAMSEVVFTRLIGWSPRCRPRGTASSGSSSTRRRRPPQSADFSFPIAERRLQAIRDDLARHLLLWIAFLPLCDAAGTRGPLDEDAAVVRLGWLDEAVLTYTGQYLNSSARRDAHPDAVDPELLSVVLQVIATADRESAGMIIGDDGGERSVERKHEWRRMAKAVRRAVRRAHPRLMDDSVQSVALLMCSEASRRSQESSTRKETAQDLSAAVVLFLHRYPGSNAEEFTSEVRSGATREAVRSIVDETMRIRIEWGHKRSARSETRSSR